jgi:hypothetical protein
MVFLHLTWINMLIFLTDNLLETTPEYSESRLMACLENLLIAHFEGKHMLIAKPKTLSNYQRESKLSERAKAALAKIKQFVRKNGLDIKTEFLFYVQVVAASQSEITISVNEQHTIVNMPIGYFEDSSATQKTIILGEHINDAEFFLHLVRAYLTTKKALKTAQIKIQAKPTHGGGSSISDIFQALCKDKTFCLCLVDTDCKVPGTTFGNTAKNLGLNQNKQQEWQNSCHFLSNGFIRIEKNSALSKAFAINVHEIENLIPTVLIENSSPKTMNNQFFDKIDVLKKWERNKTKEWRKFIDIKNGLRCYDIKKHKYWADFIKTVLQEKQDCNECHKRTECEMIFWVGLGDKILSQVVEYMAKTTSPKIAEFFDFNKNDNSLVELTNELLTWCCASERIRH